VLNRAQIRTSRARFRAATIFRRIAILTGLVVACSQAFATRGADELELNRTSRPWESISALGQRAALFGNESGRLEAWVYPLKILRNFQLRFITAGYALPGAAVSRTVTVRPASTTILYVGDTFTARETLFVPIHEQGAVITVDVSTSQPMEVEAVFERDFQLMWPAAIGGSYSAWDYTLHAFSFADDLNRYSAFVGSPDATDPMLDYESNSAEPTESSFRLGTFKAGRESKSIFIAGSVKGHDDAFQTYQRLVADHGDLLREAEKYYTAYLDRTVAVELPDKDLQRAYDWSRISVVQGLVENPTVGTGLVAGYRAAGSALRPGFAWFFGRDSMWSSLALNSDGDFATARTALEFLLKYQRADGKIPHEVVQTADVVPWFQEYPYAYGSADATPLLLITANDYVTQSGDMEFAKQNWAKLWKAYEFLVSTNTADGFAQNRGVGHGWIEGGPLHPADVEFYQAGLGVEAADSMANLARATGNADAAKQCAERFKTQKEKLNVAFWSDESKYFAFSLNQAGQRSGPLTSLAEVPMWFHLLDEEKAEETIDQLSDAEYETDWGIRLLSAKDKNYGPSGYHFGSVWPLFTGWASVGDYQYHRALGGYANLRANAGLALDGSLGHTTEVLSGDNYTALEGGTSDQIWSAAMIVSPLLRGMFGLETDAIHGTILFAPHVPADWNAFAIRNVPVALDRVDFAYRRDGDSIELKAEVHGDAPVTLDFSPAMSARAEITGAELNGRATPFHVTTTAEDQHVLVRAELKPGANLIRLRAANNFGLVVPYIAPETGDASRNLRVVSEQWSVAHDQLTLNVQGIPGRAYELGVTGADEVLSIDGGVLQKNDDDRASIRLEIPNGAAAADTYVDAHVVIHFKKSAAAQKSKKR
jgi:glycogen debranching enzyme